jgi:TrpR-related protein YerC/YecD
MSNNNSNKESEFASQLYQAISKLQTEEECRAFFEDLCTYQEINSFAQRFQVAKMLKENHIYSNIVEKTGTSTATISRVNRSLHNGNNGYDIVFERMGIKK